MKRILTEGDTDVTTTSENRKVNTNVIETRGRKKWTIISNNLTFIIRYNKIFITYIWEI
jgi:hypothetical protein